MEKMLILMHISRLLPLDIQFNSTMKNAYSLHLLPIDVQFNSTVKNAYSHACHYYQFIIIINLSLSLLLLLLLSLLLSL